MFKNSVTREFGSAVKKPKWLVFNAAKRDDVANFGFSSAAAQHEGGLQVWLLDHFLKALLCTVGVEGFELDTVLFEKLGEVLTEIVKRAAFLPNDQCDLFGRKRFCVGCQSEQRGDQHQDQDPFRANQHIPSRQFLMQFILDVLVKRFFFECPGFQFFYSGNL